MRIVHLVGWYFPESVGGTEVYVAALCRLQRDRGHDVLVAAPDPRISEPRDYEHDGVRVFRYPVPAAPTRNEAQAAVPARGSAGLLRLLAGEPPDVVHVHSVVTGIGHHEVAAARKLGARTLLTHHLPAFGYVCRRGTLMLNGREPCDGIATPGRCVACVLEGRGVPAVVAPYAAIVPRLIARAAGQIPGKIGTTLGLRVSLERDQVNQRRLSRESDVIVALNEIGRRILIANGTPVHKIVVNRLGHAHRTIPQRPRRDPSSPLRFGYIGRLDPLKGLRQLVRAVRLVPRDVRFSIEIRGPVQSAADTRFASELRSAAAGDERIVLGGPVAPADVLSTLASYDVLCCPSICFENGPTVAIEAIAVGTPVIGTRVGNMPELIDHGRDGWLVAPGDDDALSHGLAQAAAHPDLVERWRAALKPARTMADVAADYDQLYATVVAGAA